MKTDNSKKIAYKVSVITIIANVLLSAFKLAAGIISKSGAMVSDAVHSISDVGSTFIVMIGMKISSKDPDKDHPYGHERFECICAILLSAVLFATGLGIGVSSFKKISSGGAGFETPGVLALVAAVISIVTKEIMYRYTASAAKKIHSSSLKADAWHHRSDALSSVGSFAGILGSRLGFKILDPIAGVVISFLIMKAAFDIFSEAVQKVTDHSCDDKTVDELRAVILSQEGVLSLDILKTRLFGDMIYVDVEIGADKNLTLEAAHEISMKTHNAIEAYSDRIKHCMVHVNPR